MTAQAGFILSFDFELAWGNVHMTKWRERQAKGVYKNLRKVLPDVLAEMDVLDIPATWATVGAMIDEPSKRDFSHLPERWRNVVTATLSEAEPESFNGRDVFEMVLGAKAKHVIGCHSYSHIPFTYDGISAPVIGEEMQRFSKAVAPYGLRPDALVFPENREAHLDVLSDNGIRKVRVAPRQPFSNRWLNLAASLVKAPPVAQESNGSNRIIRHAGSMLFADVGQAWRVPLLRRRFDLAMKNALRHGGAVHVWSHPFNLAESSALKDGYLGILRDVARLRDAGKLKISMFG